MELSAGHKTKKREDGHVCPSSLLSKWLRLILAALLTWALIFVIAPWIQKSPSVKPLAEFIEESGIDASALYYTEVEEASEAELNMKNTIKYRPHGP